MDSQSPVVVNVQTDQGFAGMPCELDGELVRVERKSAVLADALLLDDFESSPRGSTDGQ